MPGWNSTPAWPGCGRCVWLLTTQMRNFTETYQGLGIHDISLQHLTEPVSSCHQININTELALWVHLPKLFLPQPTTLPPVKLTTSHPASLSKTWKERPIISTTRVFKSTEAWVSRFGLQNFRSLDIGN